MNSEQSDAAAHRAASTVAVAGLKPEVKGHVHEPEGVPGRRRPRRVVGRSQLARRGTMQHTARVLLYWPNIIGYVRRLPAAHMCTHAVTHTHTHTHISLVGLPWAFAPRGGPVRVRSSATGWLCRCTGRCASRCCLGRSDPARSRQTPRAAAPSSHSTRRRSTRASLLAGPRRSRRGTVGIICARAVTAGLSHFHITAAAQTLRRAAWRVSCPRLGGRHGGACSGTAAPRAVQPGRPG